MPTSIGGSVRFEIPTLATERVALRGFRADDAAAYAKLNADPAFRRYLGDGRVLSANESWLQMERALGQWALRGYGLFVVEYQGRLAGRVGVLHPADWPEPELAWGIAPDLWGRGLAAEATAAARDWAFRACGFPLLASFILPGNARSARVAAKLGASRVGQIEILGLKAERWVHPAPA
ncbi:MAG: GNAT family N-acetyltransferase [Acetobacteraceae bacterium]